MDAEKLEIGICDDSIYDLERIQTVFYQCIEELEYLQKENISLYTYSSGTAMNTDSSKRKYAMAFIDWEMPDLNGFDLAERLSRKNPEIKLLFVSNHGDTVFDAYEYTPFWFIRKWNMEKDMKKAMSKYFEMMITAQLHCKTVDGFGWQNIYLDKVMYAESNGHTVMIKMYDQTFYLVCKSLQAFEKEWVKYGFVRTHKSYLVNYKYIREIRSKTLCLLDNTELDISKNRRREIMELVKQQRRRLS